MHSEMYSCPASLHVMVSIYNMTSSSDSQSIGAPIHLFFSRRRYAVMLLHSYEQGARFSPPVDCFVSFQGPFVCTDSALAHSGPFPAILQPMKTVIRVSRLLMPCTFSADSGESPVGCRYDLSEADCRPGSAVDIFVFFVF